MAEEERAAASSTIHSPSQIAMTGHDFSPEDIQALLLGGVLADDHHHAADPGYIERPAQHQAADPTATTAAAAAASDVAPPPISNGTVQISSSGAGGDASSSTTEVSPAARAQARTERKRKLEKQRRSDVNKQFSDLQAVLRQIETEAPEIVAGLTAYSPANRVDLIQRTVSLLQNMHAAHKRHKTDVADLQEQLDNAKKAGEETAAKLKESIMAPQAMGNNKVMMMVPMLIGGDNNSNSGGAAASGGSTAAPTHAMPMMQPWMPAPHSAAGPGAAPGAMQAMPWMMPQAAAMPFMMPAAPHAAMMHPGFHHHHHQEKQDSDAKGSSSSADSKQMGGNLAHCA